MTKVNRTYKDRLFRLIFRNKRELLSLYNAINGSHYERTDDLTITTLDDVIYLSMKNDVSFLMENVLNLWEHQSSYNPNMPLRGLFYFARLYREHVERKHLNIYSETIQELPLPQYVVFYNGLREEPDRQELRLSDAFIRTVGKEAVPCLEVTALMININIGKNQELMEHCKLLREYAVFVNRVREYLADGYDTAKAVPIAISECLEEGILTEVLSHH